MIRTRLAVLLAAMSLVVAAPAYASTQDNESAQDAVNRLQSEGYKVIVSKVGNASLDQCSVSAVRPGHDVSEPVTGPVTGSRDRGQKVLYTTVFVDAKC